MCAADSGYSGYSGKGLAEMEGASVFLSLEKMDSLLGDLSRDLEANKIRLCSIWEGSYDICNFHSFSYHLTPISLCHFTYCKEQVSK